MFFYLYLIFAALLAIALIIFIITFGVPIFTGAPFAVSSRHKIKKMMPLIKEAAAGRENLTAVDLGSGDGRIVITLAQNGFIAHGLEINPFLAWYSKLKIKLAGCGGRAFIKRANYWQEDFSRYDVVVLFGVFYIMEKLEKKLLSELKPGAVVICNHFFSPPGRRSSRKAISMFISSAD
ncbi:MAG: class I SAM-dependent methyltransferase [Patescibacteria group bacterium]|nr:class I SAM-dependent methyltransferase [Patescibacteria group bacterium]